jgi:hypothetical protein
MKLTQEQKNKIVNRIRRTEGRQQARNIARLIDMVNDDAMVDRLRNNLGIHIEFCEGGFLVERVEPQFTRTMRRLEGTTKGNCEEKYGTTNE